MADLLNLPPLPRFEAGTLVGLADACGFIADLYDATHARERILLDRIAELEAAAERKECKL